MTSYRHLPAQKKLMKTGKIRRYKNLGAFNRECSKQGSASATAMMCDLVNMRKLANGEALATVAVHPPSFYGGGKARTGTWLLHFADHAVMKQHLAKRVYDMRPSSPKRGDVYDGLSGSRRRRRR